MSTIDLATRYYDCGLSIIPISYGEKLPAFGTLKKTGYLDKTDLDKFGQPKASWDLAKTTRAGVEVLRQWFEATKSNIGLVGGNVSGKVVFLDFDSRDAYKQWGLAYKTVVNNTAVARTANGYHVMVKTPDCSTSAMYYQGQHVGEIKGEGGYVVAEDSVHPTGVVYQWLIPPWQKLIEVQSLADIGLHRTLSNNGTHKPVTKSIDYTPKEEKIRQALKSLNSWRVDDYHAWLAVGMALSQMGEPGRQLWHEWSAASTKYNSDSLDKTFNAFKRNTGSIITLGTLFFWAREDGNNGQQNGWRTL